MERQSKPDSVPYIVFEGEMARQERHVKRLWIALLATITALVLTVGIFVWYLNQYDFTSYEQDGEGITFSVPATEGIVMSQRMRTRTKKNRSTAKGKATRKKKK